MASHLTLQDVSLRYRPFTAHGTGLKEMVMNTFRRPAKPVKYPLHTPKEIWALQNVSLNLQPGDRLGVLGKNGAGKSSLLKVISRVYTPTSGNVSVSGKIASLIEIGGGFHPELTGRENIFFKGAILGVSKKELAERFDSIVEFAELSEYIDMPVKYYSTGMHLRLAFAVATEVNPNILILDELYAGGDASFVQKAHLRLQKFVQKTEILIMVAHDLQYIHTYCNKAILLDHGRILDSGNPADVVERYLEFCAGKGDVFGENR